MFSGIIPALCTTFTPQGDVDTTALCELIEFLLGCHVNGFYVGGSTGEGLLMTEPERCLVAETVTRQVAGRVPVIIHVGALATSVSERLARHAREANADAVASIPPFYYAVGRRGIEAHYRRIAAAAGIPLYLYNIPGATQVDLSAQFICELYQEGIAQGLKYTSYDQLGFREIIELCGPGFNLLAGPDEMLLPFMVMGAHGGIGTTYNIVPELFVDLYAAWQAGDVERMQQRQFQVDRVILAIRDFGVIPAVKAALRMRGLESGGPRMPLMPLTEEQEAQLEAALRAIDFFSLPQR